MSYIELSAVQQYETPTSFLARDEFNQSSGALPGKTAPVGGTWTGAGATGNSSVDSSAHTATRTTTGDSGYHFDRLGTGTSTATVAQIDFVPASAASGVFARYSGAGDYVAAFYDGVGSTLTLQYELSGAKTTLRQVPLSLSPNSYYTIRLGVDMGGRCSVWVFPTGQNPNAPTVQAGSSVLATGGGLASGGYGFFDYHSAVTGSIRVYDNFWAAAATVDAAVFANQSLELRHDRAIREDSTGSFWTPMSKVEGRYLRIPPAGREGRTVRIIVKASRNDPRTGADTGIDDLTATLTVTPRVLSVPEP